jgi:hypothetical protein
LVEVEQALTKILKLLKAVSIFRSDTNAKEYDTRGTHGLFSCN